MINDNAFTDEPCYFISIASRMVGVHAQTLRYYERVGLVRPSRSMGRQRLYSYRDVQKLMQIKGLTEDMGVNLAGVEVVLKLMDHVAGLEIQVGQLTEEVKRLKGRLQESVRQPRS